MDTLPTAGRDQPIPHTALHPVVHARLDTPLADVLTTMRAARTHLAAVTGTQGDLLGFAAMADVLNELVGPMPAA